MRSAEVVVVGGGPAGSSTAWALTRLGIDTVVIDRQTFPRDKVCAGWITPAVTRTLELDLDAYRRGRVLQPIHGFRVSVLGGAEVCTRPRQAPISYGIRRCEFDDYLLRRSGARLQLGERLGTLRRDGDAWIVNETLRARMVVGAGGHFCPVARQIGARVGRGESAVLAQEIEFEMSPAERECCPVDPRVPELWFCADLRGYGWVFRKGNWLNVGLGREDPQGLADHVAAFRRFLVERGRIPVETPDEFRGHAYLLYPRAARPLRHDGILLVGDAAGLAYAESGEGIRPAVESGLLAAHTVVEAAGDYGATTLERYARALTSRLGPRRRSLAGRVLPAGLRRALAQRLLAREWFVRRVVQDRWFLHAHQTTLTAPPSRRALAGMPTAKTAS